MALDLMVIHTAAVGQIQANLELEINAYPVRVGAPAWPFVTIEGDPQEYISYYETFESTVVGALCAVKADIVIAQAGRSEDAQAFLLDLLSAGTGKTSSVVDAINDDVTLGGVVDTCICRFGRGPVQQEDGSHEARIPISIAIRRT